ncbi:serine hydrolase domain-containing protein [Algoriphagus sediminis]|uniref:Serine hydrolase domain-containing protein n=1 Tax=Algoriphagus sediminis TaxID=3057113 RepID=A0ABT7YCC7_9BACT|nr:serine hydrolase domain-containing protein [Algoriphagus sediminis]MDN3204184.1 serine hydrolase domain-containing protein [Algoriphagus sediminis]
MSFKSFFRILFIVASIICTIYFVPWLILRAWLAPTPDTIQEQVDMAMNYKLDGIIVYVDQGGKEPQFYWAGWKDRDKKIPADPNSLFKIASISKLYIAAAASKIVASGNLSLDDTLEELLPEIARHIENSDQITLRLLIQHRSGIPNYSDHPDYPWDTPFTRNIQALELIYDLPADFLPNEKYAYSNTNYLLIGEILDKTLGFSHHDYIGTEILEPLGLKRTYSLLSEVDQDKLMSGYFIGYPLDIKGNDFIHPGGSMISTAEEVAIFLRALNDGTLLTEKEQEIYSSVYVFEHTGLLPGYQSIAKYHPDIDAVVVQFVNTNGGYAWNIHEIVYNKVVKILRSK